MANIIDINAELHARVVARPLCSFAGFECEDYDDFSFEGLMIDALNMSDKLYHDFKYYALKYAKPECRKHVLAFIMSVDQERYNLGFANVNVK